MEGPGELPAQLLEVELLGATLHRSFAKMGLMDPYAVLLVEGAEVFRTKPHKWSHRQPVWNASCAVRQAVGAAKELTVQVWDRNRLHKDVHCGSATVPLARDTAAMDPSDVQLTKHGELTGTLQVACRLPRSLEMAKSNASLPSLLSSPRAGSGIDAKCLPRDVEQANLDEEDLIVLSEHEPIVAGKAAEGDAAASPASPKNSVQKADGLTGEWTCVATTGLDEFLKQTGVGMLQRQIAAKARWPAWEFTVADGRVSFINHSALGDLREQIPLDGSAYAWKDGRGNAMTCRAEWEEAADGGVLRVHKSGAIGAYTEERRLCGDTLEFVLRNGAGASWGRTFKRA